MKNIPVHVEVRLKPDQQIIPIEVNPLRFGGWCTTADLAGMSFGINPYEMFLKQEKPDWEKIFSGRLSYHDTKIEPFSKVSMSYDIDCRGLTLIRKNLDM